MNIDEKRLTRVLDRTAARVTAGTLRPLADPATAPPRRAGFRRASWNARLAPVAAATAVIAVIAAALLVTSGTHRPGPAGPAAAPGAAGPPRYYAEAEGQFYGWHGTNAAEVVVRSTATGAVAARIPNPVIPGVSRVFPISVAAGPDGRTFYALYSPWGSGPGDYWIYQFRITPSGAATAQTAISGGTITGQDNLRSANGFAVSPDGSKLAVAAAATNARNQGYTAGEIVVIDLRSGAHAVWKGGVSRPGQVFGVNQLSWTGDSRHLVYLGQWCPPDDIGYGVYGGFGCATLGNDHHAPVFKGSQAVREITVTAAGGTLGSAPVLLSSSSSAQALLQAVISPDGARLTALYQESSSDLKLVTISVADGRTRVVTTLNRYFPGGIIGAYLGADRTGRYLLVWEAGSSNGTSPDLHGWIHDGTYHQLAPRFAESNATKDQKISIQMTW